MIAAQILVGHSYLGPAGQVRKVLSLKDGIVRYEVTVPGCWGPGMVMSNAQRRQNVPGYVARVLVSTFARWAAKEVQP